MEIFLGALVNSLAIIIGSLIGYLSKKKMNDRLNNLLLSTVGIVVIGLGIKEVIQSNEIILVLVSLVLGALIGELLKLDLLVEKLTKRFVKSDSPSFHEGIITSTLIFCIGAMTILGAVQSGTGRGHSILYTKSIIDAITASVLCATIGIGVLFSSIPTLIYTSIFVIIASTLGNVFTDELLVEFSAVGGVILIAIALSSLLKIKDIKVINLIPSLIIIVLLFLLFK